MGPDRPKVKLSEGDKLALAHASHLPPSADHFPVPRLLLQRHVEGNQAAAWDPQAECVATVRCTRWLGARGKEGLVRAPWCQWGCPSRGRKVRLGGEDVMWGRQLISWGCRFPTITMGNLAPQEIAIIY